MMCADSDTSGASYVNDDSDFDQPPTFFVPILRNQNHQFNLKVQYMWKFNMTNPEHMPVTSLDPAARVAYSASDTITASLSMSSQQPRPKSTGRFFHNLILASSRLFFSSGLHVTQRPASQASIHFIKGHLRD